MGRESDVVPEILTHELALRELCASYSDPDFKPKSLDQLAEAALLEIALDRESSDSED